MSMFECYCCGGAIGIFCHCETPALSAGHLEKIKAGQNLTENKENKESSKNENKDKSQKKEYTKEDVENLMAFYTQ
jgi:hypothetical protein